MPLVDGEINYTSAEARLDAALDENRELRRGLDLCERRFIFALLLVSLFAIIATVLFAALMQSQI